MTEDIKNKIKMVTKNDERFHFAKHVVAPNSIGCFEHNNMWFYYSADEKAHEHIGGPFTANGLIYALALWYDTTELVDSLSFSESEWDIYYNNHYYSIEDVLKKYPNRNSGEIICDSMSDVWNRITANILNGQKIPHSVSRPVLYRNDDTLCLAVFVFFYNREDIENGAVDRPTLWALADLSSGKIMERFQSRDKDFSDAPYDKKYNVRSDKKYDTSKEYYVRAYDILDKVREHYLKTGEILTADYDQYIQLVLANIPDDYKRFYKDLSRI